MVTLNQPLNNSNMKTNWKQITVDVRKSSGGNFDMSVRKSKVNGYEVIDLMYDLSRSPTEKSNLAQKVRDALGVTSCTYIIGLRDQYDQFGNDLCNPLNGYVGETGDFVGRMYALRQSFNNPKYSVYHGLGRYLRRNNIGLDQLFCRVIPTKTKNEALHLEQKIQLDSRDKFGMRFAWEDGASSGRGSAVHKALDLIECITDPTELDTLVDYIKSHRKTINGKKVRSNGRT